MPKTKICVIIPAFNEERVIACTLANLQGLISSQHIYVVSDGSHDSTVFQARALGANVLSLKLNVGKANAIKKLIQGRSLTKRYQYVLFSDADSHLDKSFFKEIFKHLRSKPALVLGTVSSQRRALVSAFRSYEYTLSHSVYKRAQNSLGLISVAPGCASAYRSDVLEKIDFSHHTLTEDYDLTIQIHQKNLGKIIYVPKAVALTQDPESLRDYWKQIVRWYIGTWQNFFLHRLYRPTSKFNLEIYLLMLDNFLILALAASAYFYPWTVLRFVGLFYLTIIFMALIVAFWQKKLWIIPFIPFFIVFYLLNIFGYYWAFLKALTGRKARLNWNKVSRY